MQEVLTSSDEVLLADLVDQQADTTTKLDSVANIANNASTSNTRAISLVVGMLALAQAAVLSMLAVRQHASYGTFGYDLGLYDQASWLMSRHGFSQSVFLSSRGLPLWGHHVNPILILFAPLRLLGVGAIGLTVVQTFAVASGALPVSWLARSRTGSARMGLLLAGVYLMYPPNAWFANVSFHPEVLAVPLVLFAAWFAHARRYVVMWAMMLLALMCREEVGLVVAVFGAILFAQGLRHRKTEPPLRRLVSGATLLIVATGWFFVCTRVIIPNSLGGDPFYVATFYGKYGNSYSDIVGNVATHPSLLVELVFGAENRTFLVDLLGPFAFLSVFGSPLLIAVAPLFGLLMSSNTQAHSIQSHYPALLVAGVVLGGLEGVALMWRRQAVRKVLVGLLALSSLSMCFLRAPLPGMINGQAWKSSEVSQQSLDRAVSMIPADAAVSAQTNIVPHLTRREKLYQFPNPFDRWFYGEFALEDPAGSNAPRAQYPFAVDWIVVKPSETGKFRSVLNKLIETKQFEVVFDEDDVLVARRLRDVR
jgi:uncharacterized membrane protein